jgi:hypothetical protein
MQSHLCIVGLLFPVLEKALGLPLVYTLLAVLAAFFLNLNLVFLAIFQSSGQPLMYLRARLVQGLFELHFMYRSDLPSGGGR